MTFNLQDHLLKFWEFLRSHLFRVVLAAVTGWFTYYAGYSLTGDPIYGLTLVVLAEGLSLYWPFQMEAAQSVGNLKNINVAGLFQWISGILGVIFAWGSVILTDISSATLIAQNANAQVFSLFAEVPQWSQDVVVYVLPVSAVAHGILLTVFYVASAEAANSRDLRKIRREADHAIKQAHAEAEKARAQAEASEYKALASEAAAKAGKAKAQERIANEYHSPNK